MTNLSNANTNMLLSKYLCIEKIKDKTCTRDLPVVVQKKCFPISPSVFNLADMAGQVTPLTRPILWLSNHTYVVNCLDIRIWTRLLHCLESLFEKGPCVLGIMYSPAGVLFEYDVVPQGGSLRFRV